MLVMKVTKVVVTAFADSRCGSKDYVVGNDGVQAFDTQEEVEYKSIAQPHLTKVTVIL